MALTMMVSGCQVGNHDIVVMNTLSNKQVFQIGGEECSLKEAEVYLCNYSNLYGTAYTIDLWQHDFGENSLEDYVKDITLEELTRVYCMDLLAESQQVALNDEEKKACVGCGGRVLWVAHEERNLLYGGAESRYRRVLRALCAGAEVI